MAKIRGLTRPRGRRILCPQCSEIFDKPFCWSSSYWTTPLALVETEPNFDKNPRLETAVGFLFRPRPPATTKKDDDQGQDEE